MDLMLKNRQRPPSSQVIPGSPNKVVSDPPSPPGVSLTHFTTTTEQRVSHTPDRSREDTQNLPSRPLLISAGDLDYNVAYMWSCFRDPQCSTAGKQKKTCLPCAAFGVSVLFHAIHGLTELHFLPRVVRATGRQFRQEGSPSTMHP